MHKRQYTHELAKWVSELKYEDIPDDVVEECKNQILSVLGSIYAGSRTKSGKKVIKLVLDWNEEGKHKIIPSGKKTNLVNALLVNSSLGMVLDYDDYLLAGHTGHSAVLVPLALSETLDFSGKDFILAQTIANEVEGRIGLSVILGPLNGQAMSFIHSAGAACVYAKLTGLNEQQIINALGIALSQPNHFTMTGFFSGDSKLFTAGFPIMQGIYAAKLAQNGLQISDGILENKDGFCTTFSYSPLLSAFDNLGITWLTKTLSHKILPGCAYLAGPLDCIFEILKKNKINVNEIQSIKVKAGLMTIKMEEAVKPYINGKSTPPTTLNFYTPYNIAVALIDKNLGPDQFSSKKISDDTVWELVEKVNIEHDPKFTKRLVSNLSNLINLKIVGKQLDLNTIWQLYSKLGSTASFIALFKNFAFFDFNKKISKTKTAKNHTKNSKSNFYKSDGSGFEMVLGASVNINLVDGRKYYAEQSIPNGASGTSLNEKRILVTNKFNREANHYLTKFTINNIVEDLYSLETLNNKQIKNLIKNLVG